MDPSSGTSSAQCTEYECLIWLSLRLLLWGYPQQACSHGGSELLDKRVGKAGGMLLSEHLLTAQTLHILLAVQQPLQTRPLELAT